MFDTGLSQAQVLSSIQAKLQSHRDSLYEIAKMYAWSSGLSGTDMESATGVPAGQGATLLSAIADAHAEYLTHTTGLPPGTYPQPASAYIYAASQTQVIGPQLWMKSKRSPARAELYCQTYSETSQRKVKNMTAISELVLYKPAIQAMQVGFNLERARFGLCSVSPEQLSRAFQGRLLLNANNPLLYDAGVNGALNGFGALLNSGFLKIYTGTQPAVDVAVTGTLIVSLTFGATAFAAATASGSGGSMSANAITSGTATSTNTAGYFALVKSDNTTVVATGSVGTSAADLNLSSLSISNTANVACSSFIVTMAQT